MSLAIANGELFFHAARFFSTFGTFGPVLACPIEGCASGARVVVDRATAFTLIGEELLFATDQERAGIYRMPQAGGPPKLVLPITTIPNQLLATTDRLFWETSDGVVQTASFPGGEVQTLASYGRSTLVSMTRDESAVYFAPLVLVSTIERCPFSGCESGSEIVAGPLRRPASLIADGEHIYMLVELESAEVGLQRCRAQDCSELTLLGDKLSDWTNIAADDAFIYGFVDGDPHFTSLRRYAKSAK